MSRRVSWITALAAALLGVAVVTVARAVRSAPAQPGPSPAAVLERALAASKSPPPFSGTLQVRSDLSLPPVALGAWGGRPLASGTLRVWHDAPDLWRLETLPAPDAAASRLTVADGRTVMTWDGRTNTYRVRPQQGAAALRLPGLGRAAAWLAAVERADGGATKLTLEPDASAAGRAAYHLIAAPVAGDVLVGSLQLWSDAQTFLPLEVRLADRTGATVLSAGFAGPVAYGRSPASFFSTRPPAGAHPAQGEARGPGGGAGRGTAPGLPRAAGPSPGSGRTPAQQLAAVRDRAAFAVAQPTLLPGGRALSAARIAHGRVVLLYGKAWQTLVLAEARARGPAPATSPAALPPGARPADVNGAAAVLSSDRITSALSWVAGGVRYTLTGSMAPDQLLAVARSVRPPGRG